MTRPPPLPERSLAVVAPQVAAQLHPTRNGRLDPRAVSAGSPARVWWRCPAGHDWQTEARFRTRGSGCPFCAGRLPTADTCLAARNPVLAGQWHQTRNGVLTPTDVLPAVRARVWWQCPAGHEWAASVSSRSAGAGCPDCSRDTPTTTLLAGHPGLAAQWDTTANGALTDAVTSGSARRVGWCCSRGHRWTARVYSRTRGTGCPSCAGRRATSVDNLSARYPQLMGEWARDLNRNLDPASIRPKSSRRVWWRCTRDPSSRVAGPGRRPRVEGHRLPVLHPHPGDPDRSGDVTVAHARL